MNSLEKEMVCRLVELKEKYSVSGVKAEFEAEGTRMEEALRLKEVSMKAGLELTIKVGGCEAIKDMLEAASIGVRHVVAPMVETPYALTKFLGAIKVAFTEEEQRDTEFLINVETITSVNNFEAMLSVPDIGRLGGIVLGRVDLTGSLGLTREDVNSQQIMDLCLKTAARAKTKNMTVVVGGGVSVHSLPFFRAFPAGHLNRFETRKVVFNCPAAISNPEAAFLRAVEFEIMWLKNKKNHYGLIHREDDARLAMMEERYRKSIEVLK